MIFFSAETNPGTFFTWQLNFFGERQLLARNNAAMDTMGYQWPENEWLHFVIDFDHVSGNYSVRINDELVVDNLAMQAGQSPNSRIYFITSRIAACNINNRWGGGCLD